LKPLVAVTRDSFIESLHYGYICIVDSDGNILYQIGEPDTKIFFRSCAKPLQVIPLIQSGAARALNFSMKEIAIACASHTGQRKHQEIVEEILARLGMSESNLHCGIMNPYNEEENKRLIAQGLTPSPLHCSCSGKHSAMLALSRYRGYPEESYEKITNPVQQEIVEVIADFTGEESGSVKIGTDGCGAPIYLLPVYKIALSYARLVHFSKDTGSRYHSACKMVFDSMTEHPDMVAGDQEFCSELMQATGNKLIGKVGSEAVYCLGIREGSLGVCIKIEDGNERAVYPAVMQTLRDLGVLDTEEFDKLKHWYRQVLKNNLGEEIGEIIPVFSLREKGSNEKDGKIPVLGSLIGSAE